VLGCCLGIFIDRIQLRVVNIPATDTGSFRILFSIEGGNSVVRALNKATLRTPNEVYNAPSIPRSAFIPGQWMTFDCLNNTGRLIELTDPTKHLVIVIEAAHTADTDPLFATAAPEPGRAAIFQMQEVWDVRGLREFGNSSSRLGPRVPYNAVLSLKLCEQYKECPDDLVAQAVMPFLPLEVGANVMVDFAMNGVLFDPMLPIQVFNESQLTFVGLRPRLGSTSGDGTQIVVNLGGPLPLVNQEELIRWQEMQPSIETVSVPPPIDAVTLKLTSPGRPSSIVRGQYNLTSRSISFLVVPVSVPGPYQLSLSVNGQLFFPDDNNLSPDAETTFEFFPPFAIYTNQLYLYVSCEPFHV
jgi:hypothetical protein